MMKFNAILFCLIPWIAGVVVMIPMGFTPEVFRDIATLWWIISPAYSGVGLLVAHTIGKRGWK